MPVKLSTAYPELSSRPLTISHQDLKDFKARHHALTRHKEFGKPGCKIAGSAYFREYCAACGDPIRVIRQQIGRRNLCVVCQRAPAA